ncbi:NUDIX domain-containing protein [Couchioplanes caeruleus]|uniref:NUDIX hydrolase n=1 Tax=Couchioplanes caeruleus subsp. caeruleus TaxID=56427 RepID=A0A1K0FAF5_9ACTN|nr:NUDIX hydrolase [Couchioplanes caeruleus]OJF09825.1 NUDIX hydrolase [Couchioplanes caeruleus subsp. caeruleus]
MPPPTPPFAEHVRTYTHPDVLTTGVRDGWADPETDPRRIDWTARQAAAAIPFEVIGGRPVNPCESTGIRYGRNELGHWGEALAADAMVTATDSTGARWLLMVERCDGRGWALPGGFVDPGETPTDAAVRELAEETGLRVPADRWRTEAPRYVPDSRVSDEAWMVTVLSRTDLGTYPVPADFPPVHGSDDAARAAWLPAHDYRTLVHCLAGLGAEVFPAHRQMLTDTLTA